MIDTCHRFVTGANSRRISYWEVLRFERSETSVIELLVYSTKGVNELTPLRRKGLGTGSAFSERSVQRSLVIRYGPPSHSIPGVICNERACFGLEKEEMTQGVS